MTQEHLVAQSTPDRAYRVDDLMIDVVRQRITRDRTEIPLSGLSFELLLVLTREAPKLVSLQTLMDRVWPGVVIGPETVCQRVKLVRDALGDDANSPRYIAGVRGRGYRLIADVAPLSGAASDEMASGLGELRRASDVGNAVANGGRIASRALGVDAIRVRDRSGAAGGGSKAHAARNSRAANDARGAHLTGGAKAARDACDTHLVGAAIAVRDARASHSAGDASAAPNAHDTHLARGAKAVRGANGTHSLASSEVESLSNVDDGSQEPAASAQRSRWSWVRKLRGWRAAAAIMVVLTLGAATTIALQVFDLPESLSPASWKTVTVMAPRTVAVLPFETLSTDPKDEYIALGIAETVLHKLAGVRDLIVISRTSSFAYRNASEDVREIGRKLNARYVIEGSVQRVNSRLRVTARLVDTSSGGLWSIRVDREVGDVFAVEDEISQGVARKLQAMLETRRNREARRNAVAGPKATAPPPASR